MKVIKSILGGVAVSVALISSVATAQISYNNGDLLAGFGNGGSTDVVVDLGSIDYFESLDGSSTSWNLHSLLTSTFGSLSSVYWSAFGVNDQSTSYNHSVTQGDPNTVWATVARSNPFIQTHAPYNGSGSATFNLSVGDIETIASLTTPGAASPGKIVNYAPGIVLVDTSLGGFSHMMTSPYNGNLQADWSYNMLNTGAGVSDLYLNNPQSQANYLGNFSLDASGNLTFNAVPEPSSLALAGLGLLAISLRAGLRRKQA